MRRTVLRQVAATAVDAIRGIVASELNTSPNVVGFLEEAIKEDLSVPFVARYRRHRTDGMTETQVEGAMERIIELRAVFSAREKIIADLQKRELLTDDITKRINSAITMAQIEAVYHPFKIAKKTNASKGRELGLDKYTRIAMHTAEPIPADMWKLDDEQMKLLRAIIIEEMSMVTEAGAFIEEEVHKAIIRTEFTTAARKAAVKDLSAAEFAAKQAHFKAYDNRTFRSDRILAHQTLAINRAEAQGLLKVSVECNSHVETRTKKIIVEAFPQGAKRTTTDGRWRSVFQQCLGEAYSAHVLPHAVRVLRSELKLKAENESMAIFRRNFRRQISQRPLRGHVLLAVDPGYANGCKWAILSPSGDVLGIGRFFLPKDASKAVGADAFGSLRDDMVKHGVTRVAVGDGTASYEAETCMRNLVATDPALAGRDIQCCRSSEHGASVYSASPVAQEELGHLDVLYRSAVSIGRRVLDPLSEIVKIPARSTGHGLYQHDIPERKLAKGLNDAAVSAVARVGVDVNTASYHVLSKVPGLSDALAKAIVTHRAAVGAITSRSALLRVRGISKAAYEKAIGFIRIKNPAEPLDDTSVHPETYDVTRRLLAKAGVDLSRVDWDQVVAKLRERYGVEPLVRYSQPPTLDFRNPVPLQPAYVGTDEDTFVNMTAEKAAEIAADVGGDPQQVAQIVDALCAPRADPRDNFPLAGLFSDELRSMAKARVGMKLYGRVDAVVPFGLFIDVGMEVVGFAPQGAIFDDQGGVVHLEPTVVLGPCDVVMCTITAVEPAPPGSKGKGRLRVSVTLPRSAIPAALAALAEKRFLQRGTKRLSSSPQSKPVDPTQQPPSVIDLDVDSVSAAGDHSMPVAAAVNTEARRADNATERGWVSGEAGAGENSKKRTRSTERGAASDAAPAPSARREPRPEQHKKEDKGKPNRAAAGKKDGAKPRRGGFSAPIEL